MPVLIACAGLPGAGKSTIARAVADGAGARLVDVEVVWSDVAEHRRRVETRTGDIHGLALPTWDAVQQREYHTWDRPRLVLDTAGRDAAACVHELLDGLGLPPGAARAGA